jgi:hypothetical protein
MDGAAESHAAAAAAQETPPPQGTLVDEAARVAATLNDKLPTLSQETRIRGGRAQSGAPTDAARESQAHENREAFDAHAAANASSPVHEMRESSATGAEEATGGTPAVVVPPDTRGGRMRQRAASVGASMGENLRPRVEKLREASTVVFDEASDDPGLRFVIVAALLFLLFLFILLFSYILG